MCNFRRICILWLAALQFIAWAAPLQARDMSPGDAVPKASLSVEEIVKNLEEKSRERASALHEFQGTRIYRMSYRGFPGDRDAEMVVRVSYRPPNTKEFTVLSKSGNKFLLEHVFKQLLQGEQEAASEENRKRIALDTTNYDFRLLGLEASPTGPQYLLSVDPKSSNKFLYRGRIWVDAHDFALTRIEGEPARNPSFWIKKTEIKQHYQRVDNFWLPAENHSESWIRIGGRAILSIEYKDYRVIRKPMQAGEEQRENAPASSAM